MNKITGLSNLKWDKDNLTQFESSSRAATEAQLNAVVGSVVDEGLNFQGDTGGAINKDLGATMKIVGATSGTDVDESKYAEGNIAVVRKTVDKDSVLVVEMAKAINVDSVTAETFTTGTTTVSDSGLNIKGTAQDGSNDIVINQDNVSFGGNQITNIGSGLGKTYTEVGDNNAASIGDIKTLTKGLASEVKSGSNLTVGNVTDAQGKITYTVNLDNQITLGYGPSTDADGKPVAGDAGSIILNDANGNNQIALNGATGTGSIGVIKFNDVADNDPLKTTEHTNTITGLSNTTWDKLNKEQYKDSYRAATEAQLYEAIGNAVAGGLTYKGDSGKADIDLGNVTNIIGGASNIDNLTNGNIGVVAGIEKNASGESTGNALLEIKLNKDIDLGSDGSIKVGETIIDKSGVTTDKVKIGNTALDDKGLSIKDGPSMTQEGIDAGKKVITGVAAGKVEKDSTEAINGDQLNTVVNAVNNLGESMNNMGAKVNRLGNRVNQVGARAAALAALHPMDFDPDEKLSFAAGYGNYHGESAGALGAFYRPDEKTMISLSGTATNKDNMFNVGVSFALDRTPNQTNSKTAMAKQIIDLSAKVDRLNDANDKMMNALTEVTALCRALLNGTPVDANAVKGMDEVAKSLNNVSSEARFRVDRIAGQDDDRNKIERVRTNHESDENIPDYRDVYGSKIAPPAKK